MTMLQVITVLGHALDKNQGTHLNRMMAVWAFKYRQHIKYWHLTFVDVYSY